MRLTRPTGLHRDRYKGIGARLRLVRIAGLLLIAAVAVGCSWNPADNGYEVVWQDDFNGTALGSDWTVRWDNGDIVVDDGLLTLTNNGQGWTGVHTTGPRSATEPNYPNMVAWQEGYFEARVRWDDNAFAWPAVWLFSTAHTESFPTMDAHCPTLVAELDIMESLVPKGHPTSPHQVHHTLHENTKTVANDPDGSCGQPDDWNDKEDEVRTVAAEGQDLSDWHTWGARWTADEVCWYMDNVESGCYPTYDSTAQPMHWILSAQVYKCRSDWLYPDGCPPAPPVQTMQVDWVKVWQLA